MTNIQKSGSVLRFFGVKLVNSTPPKGTVVALFNTITGQIVARGNLDQFGGWELFIPISSVAGGYHEIRFFGCGLVEALPSLDNGQHGSWETIYVAELDASYGIVTGEQLKGTIDGVNRIFITAQPFVSGTIEVLHNGLVEENGVHYLEQGNAGVLLSDAPATGDVLTCNYRIKQ